MRLRAPAVLLRRGGNLLYRVEAISPSRRRLTLEPINHELSGALHGALMVIGGILNLLLHPSGFDGAQRSSRLLDLVQDAFHSVLDLIREILDVFTSALRNPLYWLRPFS